ncbi:MAG: hypothetical protein NZ703_05115 [Gemmataceae bacterium]|nr:hypothetical protein [Gemmataceae bacterium]MCS7270445.1 hypothetical protein [Gemmataceae bacterium]MDW8244305.1 hypothetical protein [Thermogemmata sp.]
MFARRYPQDQEQEQQGAGLALGTETLRAASTTCPENTPPAKEEEKISLFWRIFGGTILSMVALGALTMFNNISGNISELRRDLNQEREARAELVRKQDFHTLLTQQAERLRLLEALKAEVEGLKERLTAQSAIAEGIKKEQAQAVDLLRKELDALRRDLTQTAETNKREAAAAAESTRKELQTAVDALKKDVAALESLRERLTAVEGLKKDVAIVELLRERLTNLTTENKTLREELARLQQEIERNKAADHERKMLRDEQYKQIDQTLKELQKELQLAREKLARLETALPVALSQPPTGTVTNPPSPSASPAPRPTRTPNDSETTWFPFHPASPKK